MRGWGSPGRFRLRLRLRLRMTCTAFGSSVFVFVHPMAIDSVRISNSFEHFDLKICFHNKSYQKTRHKAFVSRLLIPLDLIFFRSRLAFFDGSAYKSGWPSRSGYVPSGSGGKHHFVTQMDSSVDCGNPRSFDGPFRDVIHSTFCW